MTTAPDASRTSAELVAAIGTLVRRLRQHHTSGDLTLPEASALARLDRGGPSTCAALAKLEQISPQSMGATLGTLEQRGLLRRQGDPDDGRRVVLSLTPAGVRALTTRRGARVAHLTRVMSEEFSGAELAQLAAVVPLLDRLAERL